MIAPSLLAADLSRLAEEANRMTDAGAEWIHLDIMDGHFVPNLTFGPPVVQSLRKHTNAFLDCHCMVTDPAKWIAPLAKAGASQVTFHLEAVADDSALLTLINDIKEQGMQVGVALKPATSADELTRRLGGHIDRVDTLLVMTVEPGFGGQKFMVDQMSKVEQLRARYPGHYIQVDGGLNAETVVLAAKAGANVIVAGSSVFTAADPKEAILALRKPLK